MSNRAWVTLATNDSYGLGALVLAHSLRRAGSTYPAVVLITPSVTDAMRERLRSVFAELINVDVLDSRDATHLALLQRPELGITFTKIHCWSLTQYEKCVFLDADTLIVQNCDELFEREELSAAPDVGWPDCFNSGVFVFTPSADTYSRLISFAQERGSFDGGDQGLLNAFFSDWARGDINKHLPFLYNVTSAAFYSYLPALKHYGQNLKIIHFIGSAKPWLQHFNWESRSVDAPDHLSEFLQLWWDLFVSQVHPQLDTAMESTVEVEEAPPDTLEYPEDTEYHYEPTLDPGSEFPWHRPEALNQDSTEQQHQVDVSQYYDPWMHYRGNIPLNSENSITLQKTFEIQGEINRVLSEYRSPQQEYNPNTFEANVQNVWHQSHQHHEHGHSNHQPSEDQWENNSHHQYDYNQHDTHAHTEYGNQSYSENTNHYDNVSSLYSGSQELRHDYHHHSENINPSSVEEPQSQNQRQYDYTQYANAFPKSRIDSGDHTQRQQSQEHKNWELHRLNEPRPQEVYQLHLDARNRNQGRRKHMLPLDTPACGLTNGHDSETDSEKEYIVPRHPYDGYYLRHRPTIDPRGRKICMHEIPPTPSPSPPESLPSLESASVLSEDYHSASECEEQSGVAGNLARVVPGDAGYQREAIDELSRRQGWEAGNIDYMGADSFDNIWAKISQTLNQPRTSPPKQPSPPRKEPSPPKVPEAQVPAATEPASVEPAAPAAIEIAAPTATGTPVPAAIETLAPAATETLAPAATETPAPAATETPAPAATETPAPAAIETSVPAATETSAPAVTETAETAATGTPAPAATATPVPAATVIPAPTPVETPAPAEPQATPAPATPSAPVEPAPPTETAVAAAPVAVAERTEPTVPPTSTPEPLPPVSAPVEATTVAQSAPVPEQASNAAEPTPVAAASPAPTAEEPASPAATTPAQPAVTPEKPSAQSAAPDSPPLANTPSKEEAPSVAAAKSEERRKPAGKLQLSPPTAADPLPTPDSELEDAASLAHAIIASELSATVTAPSPAADPASPPFLKEDTKLSVAEPEVPTPPVSLEQIGVKPKGKTTTAAQIESSVAEQSEPTTPTSPTKSSAPSTPTAEAPKKKIVKKPAKKEGGPSGDVPTPVPPPRKKEKKPKEK